MPLVSVICPKCNERIQLDDTKEHGFCTYCGSKLTLIQDTQNITSQNPASIKEAVDQNNLEGLKKLLDDGAKANIYIGNDPIIKYIINKKNISFYRLIEPLAMAGANLYSYSYSDGYGYSDTYSSLYYAIKTQNIILLETLLKSGMEPNFSNEQFADPDNFGRHTPLHAVIFPLLAMALTNDVNPDKKEVYFKMGKMLIDYGADYKRLKRYYGSSQEKTILKLIVEYSGKSWGLF